VQRFRGGPRALWDAEGTRSQRRCCGGGVQYRHARRGGCGRSWCEAVAHRYRRVGMLAQLRSRSVGPLVERVSRYQRKAGKIGCGGGGGGSWHRRAYTRPGGWQRRCCEVAVFIFLPFSAGCKWLKKKTRGRCWRSGMRELEGSDGRSKVTVNVQ
jgi:hypothetical protein